MMVVPKTRKRYSKSALFILTLGVVFVVGLTAMQLGECGQVQAAALCPILHPQSLDTSVALAPNYYQYTEENLAASQASADKTVLYFWAPWCVNCTALDHELQGNKQLLPSGVTVLRVDYDLHPELKQKYHVVTQHTFVQIDDDGNPVATWVGGEIDNFAKYLQ